jgi:hypothetical protein
MVEEVVASTPGLVEDPPPTDELVEAPVVSPVQAAVPRTMSAKPAFPMSRMSTRLVTRRRSVMTSGYDTSPFWRA